ncbi:hypothetical protein E1265_24280 [Streptomyces sp. 8K308]|uniref:hypothetical protein n=1 Tax=Streptomyces sp. 8K308 TaxID=2530388 RepID=UPI00104BC57F|nr:hypothetical protein [Streptomyces sp. 8K308]TDC19248.1 hypothetical protein E1265_24280 [Streptomyces sp. 8K308]
MRYEGFTVEDVRRSLDEGAGSNPWDSGESFLREIDPEDMGETALVYARAAGEARGAGELAKLSDRLAADSGARDGVSFVEAEERLEETGRGLAGRGEGLSEVVDNLRLSMADAVDTRAAVRSCLHDEDGLYATTRRHIAEARRQWEQSRDAELCVPDDLPERIVEFHKQAAVDDARAIGERISDAIGSYRLRLFARAGELLDQGYDVTDGALDLWLTPENARYVAQGVRAELWRARENPEGVDPEFMLRNLEQLRAIVERARTSCDGWGVTPEEYGYLDAFYEEVGGGKAFTRLGWLLERRDELGLEPGDQGRLTAVTEAFADGVLTAYGRDTVRMPESLADLFRVYKGREDQSWWFDFERFGEVMGHASAKPSRRMVEDLVSTAVVSYRSQHLNTGSEGVLHAALLNPEEAGDVIPGYREPWADRRLAEARAE